MDIEKAFLHIALREKDCNFTTVGPYGSQAPVIPIANLPSTDFG